MLQLSRMKLLCEDIRQFQLPLHRIFNGSVNQEELRIVIDSLRREIRQSQTQHSDFIASTTKDVHCYATT